MQAITTGGGGGSIDEGAGEAAPRIVGRGGGVGRGNAFILEGGGGVETPRPGGGLKGSSSLLVGSGSMWGERLIQRGRGVWVWRLYMTSETARRDINPENMMPQVLYFILRFSRHIQNSPMTRVTFTCYYCVHRSQSRWTKTSL